MIIEVPFFTTGKSVKTKTRIFEYKNTKIRLYALGDIGHPNTYDQPIYSYAIAIAGIEYSRTGVVPKIVKYTIREYLAWRDGELRHPKIKGREYQAIRVGLLRISGLRIVGDFQLDGGEKIMQNMGLLGETKLSTRGIGQESVSEGTVSLELPNWTRSAISNHKIVTMPSAPVFYSMSPWDRRVFEVLSVHLGNKPLFRINIDNLLRKTGIEGTVRKFRFNLKKSSQILNLEINIRGDIVEVRPRGITSFWEHN